MGEPMCYQLLPTLSEDEFAALKTDIAERGVLVPIEYDEEGNCLDGHHRLRAVAELRASGVAVANPPTVVRTGLDEEAKRRHVYTLNLARRALTSEQKRQLAVQLRGEGWTLQAIGNALAVSYGTAHGWCLIVNSDNEPPTIVNARGQERPTTYTKREPEAELPGWNEPEAAKEQPAQEPTPSPTPADRSFSEAHEPEPSPVLNYAACHSSAKTGGRDDWATPQDLFDLLDEEFAFDLDVCATDLTAKCERYFTIEDNALEQSWAGRACFMNPPYSEVKTWVTKARNEALDGGATVVCLIRVATGSSTWWELIRDAAEVRFLRGRLRFDEAGAAPFDSAVVIFGPTVVPKVLFWTRWRPMGDDDEQL